MDNNNKSTEITYKIVSGKYGFGYSILRKQNFERKLIATSSDYYQLKELVKILKEYDKNPDDNKLKEKIEFLILNLRTDFIPQLLTIENQKYICYNPDEVDKICFSYLLEYTNGKTISHIPTCISQTITKEDIENCKNNEVREKMIEVYVRTEQQIIEDRRDKEIVNLLNKKIIEKDYIDVYNIINNAYNIFECTLDEVLTINDI